MHYILDSILLLWVVGKFAVGLIDIQDIRNDLEKLNKTCKFDKCSYSHFRFFSPFYACYCDDKCVQFNTCCVNSSYIQPEQRNIKPTCRSVYNGCAFFMIDSCPIDDSIWVGLCHDEWNGEDDILKIVPVTSLSTNITYKNYFCFRCHETDDKFLYWKTQFESEDTQFNKSGEEYITDNEKQHFSLTYDSYDGEWIISLKNNSIRIPVNLSLEIPSEISPLVKVCDSRIISKCSNEWTDTEVSEKCQAYKSVRVVERDGETFRYKNLHCALCNFENINDVTCQKVALNKPCVGYSTHGIKLARNPSKVDSTYGSKRFSFKWLLDVNFSGDTSKKIFSFSYLFDVNNSYGDRVGKIVKCDEDHIWDPFTKKCRKLVCAFSGYKLKNRKCQQD